MILNKIIKFIVLISILLTTSSVNATQMKCHGQANHWRDVAYSTGVMSKYKDVRNCIAWSAYQFNLPEELLYAMLDVERGPVNGTCRNNRNGTQDCGPAQINDVRLKELGKFHLSKSDIKSKPCHNIWAMGYLIRREIEKSGGKIWRGVGNYHYHYSVNPDIHNRYVRKVKSSWRKLNKRIENYCSQQ